MAKPDPEALAKALRENLLKRKAQGRGDALAVPTPAPPKAESPPPKGGERKS